MRGNCRAAPASARGTGRTAYTKDVRPSLATTLRVLEDYRRMVRHRHLHVPPSQLTVSPDCGPRPAKPRLPLAQVGTRSPSPPSTIRGRPSAHLCFTPTRRTLAAALNSSHRPPSRIELTMHAASRRLHLASADACVGRGNRRAAARESDLDALTPRADAAHTPCYRQVQSRTPSSRRTPCRYNWVYRPLSATALIPCLWQVRNLGLMFIS
jgi:hypothetical protein